MEYHDIKVIGAVDTRVNFIIKCEGEEELESLKKMLQTNKRMIPYEYFAHQFSKAKPE